MMLFVLLVFTGTTYAERKSLFFDLTPCTTWVMDLNSGVKLLVLTSKPEGDEGIVYEWVGESFNGYAQGEGIVNEYEKGIVTCSYKGSFVRGKMQGHFIGKVYGANEGNIEWHCIDGNLTGKLTLVSTKIKMEFNMENNKMSSGLISEPDENCMIEFKCANGQVISAKMNFANGSYEGGFNRNGMNGRGILRTTDGTVYEGEFLNNNKHGKGKLIFPNGKVYIGDFVEGEITGEGTLYDSAGKIIGQGRWEKNKLVESTPAANDPAAYYTRGLKYEQSSKNDLALADYNHAIEMDPNCIEAYIYRGRLYEKIRKYDLAIADYCSVLKSNPNHGSAYVSRGECYRVTGRIDLAIADFNQALAINPNDVNAYIKRGELSAAHKQFDLALADLNRAVELEKSNTPFALYSRAKLLKNMGRYEDALEDYKHALRNAPHDIVVYFERGNLYEEMRQYDLAIADYSKGIEIYPSVANGYQKRGAVYGKSGQYDLAVTDYRKALQLKIASSTLNMTCFNLAQALELTEQQDEAATYYQEALKYGLIDKWKAKAESRLSGDWNGYKEWM